MPVLGMPYWQVLMSITAMLRASEGTCESDVGLVVLRDYLSQEISVGPSETRKCG
jgi:hypothetical protein